MKWLLVDACLLAGAHSMNEMAVDQMKWLLVEDNLLLADVPAGREYSNAFFVLFFVVAIRGPSIKRGADISLAVFHSCADHRSRNVVITRGLYVLSYHTYINVTVDRTSSSWISHQLYFMHGLVFESHHTYMPLQFLGNIHMH